MRPAVSFALVMVFPCGVSVVTFLESTADFSECREFRWKLTRRWSDGPTIAVIGLNPSTADAEKLDPTVTRCVRRADALGFGELVMLNLFAFRSTARNVLTKRHRAGLEIVGSHNDDTIRREARAAEMVLCCWGADGALAGRGSFVLAGPLAGLKLHCLETTKSGHPQHPLYLPYSLEPRVFGKRA